jgi:hypothetical protein
MPGSPNRDGGERQAFDITTIPMARTAMHVDQEPPGAHSRYGRFWESFVLSQQN